jgi:hypothetical protein
MVAWDRVNQADLRRAMKEYNRLGPEQFFSKFATGQRLASGGFKGGKTGAVRVLGQLGFTVRENQRPAS